MFININNVSLQHQTKQIDIMKKNKYILELKLNASTHDLVNRCVYADTYYQAYILGMANIILKGEGYVIISVMNKETGIILDVNHFSISNIFSV